MAESRQMSYPVLCGGGTVQDGVMLCQLYSIATVREFFDEQNTTVDNINSRMF